MKNKLHLLIVAFLVLSVAGLSIFFFNKKSVKTPNDLININELSAEFMDNYFAEISEINNSENPDNILIVISKDDINNLDGVKNIVKGPNNQYFIEYNSEEDKENGIKILNKNKDILSVEENSILTLDASYNSWGITKTKLDNAITMANSVNLPEVVVAVIDSGLDVTIANRYFNGKIKSVYDVTTSSASNITDENGHGTHVFGTIAEGTPNNVKIMPIKVTTDKYGNLTYTNLISAINYIVYNRKADVINMSLGGYSYNQALEQAIESANQLNIITVAAAGNDGEDGTQRKHYPSAFSNTISISSVNSNLEFDSLYSNSNYGSTITFSAPGALIKSTMSSSAYLSILNGNNSGADFETISGTSMATPHASAAVAILKSYNKNITLENTITLLRKFAKDLGDEGWDQYFGYGFISFDDAVFCNDGIDCDEFGVFKIDEVKRIEITNPVITNYNYGSLNNILASELSIYYNNVDYETKKLWELDDVEIVNYNPYQVGSQVVTINYKGQSTTLTVNHLSNYESGWIYTVNNNQVTITGYKDNNYHIGKLYLPSVINNKSVKTINNCFSNSSDINYYEEIIIPSSITTIGDNVFKNNTTIKKVSGLGLNINIGTQAFMNASNLETFEPNILSVANGAFKGCSKINNLNLSNSLTVINDSAFMNCSNLDSINFPTNLVEIGDSAFAGDTKLRLVVLPNSLTTIGSQAFYNTGIISLRIPRYVTNIAIDALANCSDLATLEVDQNNNTYDSRNNSNTIIKTSSNTLVKGLYTSTIPSTVVEIGAYSFSNDQRITTITIPSNITSIAEGAFKGCTSLSTIYLPNSITTLGEDIFDDTDVTIWTYKDNIAKTYAGENSIRYETYDFDKVEASINKIAYQALDVIEDDDISGVTLYYNRGYYENNVYHNEQYGRQEIITSGYTISYQNGDSLIYGDSNYTISGMSSNNFPFTINVNVIVNKRVPTYNVPTNLTGIEGSQLSTIDLPDNFEWMDDTIILSSNEVYYYVKYVPDDTINYSIIENIEVIVNASESRELIVPNIVVDEKEYDGTNNLPLSSIRITNLSANDYTIVSAYLDTSSIGPATASVTIRLSDSRFISNYLEGELQEKEYQISTNIIPFKVTKPTVKNKTYTYNTVEQTLEFNAFNGNYMEVSNNTRTDAGSQQVIVSLISDNYVWDDNTNDDLVFTFTINKANPIYKDNSTNNEVVYDGINHTINMSINTVYGAVTMFMDSNNNYSLNNIPQYSNPGVYVVKYKVYMPDNDNYSIYYGEKTLTISKNSISYTASDYEGYYDGKEHTISISSSTPNVTIKYSLNNGNYNLSSIPKFKDIGEHTVYFQLTKDGYTTKTGSKKVYIYGINDFSNKLTLKNSSIIVANNSFQNIKNSITGYAINISYYHNDNNNLSVASNSVKTGDKIKILLNNSKSYEYDLSLMGDISGDGLINSADLLQIRQYLLGSKSLNGAYFYAGDLNKDDLINSADLLRIRQHLLGVKTIQ